MQVLRGAVLPLLLQHQPHHHSSSSYTLLLLVRLVKEQLCRSSLLQRLRGLVWRAGEVAVWLLLPLGMLLGRQAGLVLHLGVAEAVGPARLARRLV
jgi:hypothetical protein